MGSIDIRVIEGGLEFEVLVSAGSSRSEVKGPHGGTLKVAVRAPPERGKANREVEEVLAAFLGLSTRQVAVVSGQTARRKRVRVLGVAPEALRARLG